MIELGSKPASSPRRTSCIETVSRPAPRVWMYFKMETLESAFVA